MPECQIDEKIRRISRYVVLTVVVLTVVVLTDTYLHALLWSFAGENEIRRISRYFVLTDIYCSPSSCRRSLRV